MATHQHEKGTSKDDGPEANPVVVDPTAVGVKIDSPEADPEHADKRKGVRRDEAGRELYPWEVDPKDQAGPAGESTKKR